MRLKICDSHLTCKVVNKCLNVREWVEVVDWNKRWPPPFPCCPVSRQCLCKKTLIEKKMSIYKNHFKKRKYGTESVYICSTGFSNWGRKQHKLLNATDKN